MNINEIELASNLAHEALVSELVVYAQTDGEYSLYECEDDLMEEDDNGDLRYKDDVQDVFNKYYDMYLYKIEKCSY